MPGNKSSGNCTSERSYERHCFNSLRLEGVQLIKKLIDKLFTLTAFISAACLAVHYAPAFLIFEDYSLDPFDKMRYTLAPLFSLEKMF